MEFRGNGNKLEIFEQGKLRHVYTFPDYVTQIEIIPNRGVAVLTRRQEQSDPPSQLDNVSFFGLDGKFLWRICKIPFANDPFTGIEWKDGKLYAYSYEGNDYEVNIDNGEIKWLAFTK